MSSNTQRIGILLLLCALPSCSASIKSEPTNIPELSRAPQPSQEILAEIRQEYPVDRYLIGIGEGTSEMAATEVARADLLKQTRVAVKVIWSDVLRERGGQSDQEVSRLVETRATELVTGTEIVRRGKDSSTGIAYAVAVLPRTEVARILRQQDRAATPLEPMIPDRQESNGPVWIVAEGVVPFGPDTTLAEAKSRARDEARRQAVERAAGIFLRGQRVVYNTQLADDLVRSLVRGIIIEEQILEEGIHELITDPTGPKAFQYTVKLRTRVKPVRTERRGDFAVTANLNKTVFSGGEEMQIKAVATKDAYLHIFSVGQDDTVTVLYPNRFVAEGFVRAEKQLVFPDEAQRMQGLRLRVFLQEGSTKAIEKIKLIATAKKIDLTKGTIHEGVFQMYPGKDSALVTDLLKELARLDESEWAEATIPYEIKR